MRRGGLRFTDEAAAALREEIRAAGGVEVYAVGQLDDEGRVCAIEVHARGHVDKVPAIFSRASPGEVVVHNHPSGNLRPSEPDLLLAGRFGEHGIGFVIVDCEVTRANWVVEPRSQAVVPLDPERVRRFFEEVLPRHLDGHEARAGQVEMAVAVAEALNRGPRAVALFEAGTGTGKSLAYLVPAAMWAVDNGAPVVVATYTRSLQAQLRDSDAHVLEAAGLGAKIAVLQGRGNYLCRRKLEEMRERVPHEAVFRRLADWAATSPTGNREDLTFQVAEEDWEDVASSSRQSLKARCRHYDECFYYGAAARAAAAHVVVVNHSLLLLDLVARSRGHAILPHAGRIVVDEAHHLPEAAASVLRSSLSLGSVRHAVRPLLGSRRRPSALDELAARCSGLFSGGRRADADFRTARAAVEGLEETARTLFEALGRAVPGPGRRGDVLRIDGPGREGESWERLVRPTLGRLGAALREAVDALDVVVPHVEQLPGRERLARPQPIFDLEHARERLAEQAAFVEALVGSGDPDRVAWIELRPDRAEPDVPLGVLHAAPVETGDFLAEALFGTAFSVVLTSATLRVGGSFEHARRRLGLEPPAEAVERVFPSPFDYERQALVAVPLDSPKATHPAANRRYAEIVARAVVAAGGGALVLCTSHAQVREIHDILEERLGGRFALFRQGTLPRPQLLERFQQAGNGVLVGTSSFWEGVSVEGEALRLVAIARLPFERPDGPVAQAREERLKERGFDPFRDHSLPEAALRFRQGVGRLVRSRRDRGVVLVLDSRIATARYGQVFLDSLPPMRQVVGNTEEVLAAIERFFRS